MKQLLFHLKDATIEITIEANFNGEHLIIEGYDVGEAVKDALGDADYEYSMTLPPESVQQVYKLFALPLDFKEALLKAIAAKYNDSFCYSQLMELFNQAEIKFDSFSWT